MDTYSERLVIPFCLKNFRLEFWSSNLTNFKRIGAIWSEILSSFPNKSTKFCIRIEDKYQVKSKKSH